MYCFHALPYLFSFSTNQRIDHFAVWGLSVLTSSLILLFDDFACFLLHFRNAGFSRRRAEEANMYGLCYAISPDQTCYPRPHISEHLSIDWHDRKSLTVAENDWFRLFGVQQTLHFVHCSALHMGNRAFAVCSEKAGSDCCHLCAALRVTF